VAVSVFDLGPVIVILIDADPDTETVDVLLGMFDFVFVILTKDVGDVDVVDDVVFDILAVAVVVGLKVDVFDPTEECVVLGDPVDVLEDVIVEVVVSVINAVFVDFTEEEADADAVVDFEEDIDFVVVPDADAVFVCGGDLLYVGLEELVFEEDTEPVEVFVTVVLLVVVVEPVVVSDIRDEIEAKGEDDDVLERAAVVVERRL
jgi:hypothetical protein